MLHTAALGVMLVALTLTGCGYQTTEEVKKPAPKETTQAALDKLSPEDRAVAEAQEYCAVMSDEKLGSMGTPFKVMVQGQPVFLCCKGCQKKALANPEKTLAKVAELKEHKKGR